MVVYLYMSLWFCVYSIAFSGQRGAEPLVVLDATTDWRFANNVCVISAQLKFNFDLLA